MHAAEYHGCTRRPLPGSPAAARYSTETPLCFSWSAVTPLHALDLARVYEPQNMSPMHMTPPHHASDMPHPPRRFFTAATKPRIEDVAGPMLHGIARPTVPAGRRHRDRWTQEERYVLPWDGQALALLAFFSCLCAV